MFINSFIILQIRVIASDILGLHYALCTLGQLFSLYHEDCELPSLFVSVLVVKLYTFL